ncbi:MAG TPA: hypothetical protein VFQ07_02435 [Candidatus Polarisedimenticolia bacterium]|nr:hypothetical protein [Candidatus Polarisedimenticolia bacterium]
MKLGAWLLSRGKISEDQLQRALQHQQFFGGRLGSSLIKLGHIDEDVLGAYLSDVAGAPYAPPARLDAVPPEVVALVPARLASQYRVVPLELEGRRLRLAMRDPKDLIALDEIAFLTGMMIEPYVATDFRIQQALQRYYQVSPGPEALPVASAAAPVTAPPSVRRVEPPAAKTETPTGPAPIGFDGFPLDADPGPILMPTPHPGTAPPAGAREAAPPPTSLEQWRQAQDDIPEEIPAPDPRWATPPAPLPPPGPVARAIALAPAPEPIVRTAPLPIVTPSVPASSIAAPPAQGESPADAANLEAAALRLQRAETRDDVFAVILDFVAARYRRSALFVVQGDRVTGWSGRGEGIEPIRVRQVTVSLDWPSLFSFFRGGADFYQGPVADQPANTRFYLDLGCPPPARALLLPLRIKDRPAVILYADNASDSGTGFDATPLRRLLAKASLALEILILRTKILTV